MPAKRVILELGTGNDLHGGDYTKAALRAVQDALHHSSLAMIRSLKVNSKTGMFVDVTIGVQRPEMVDLEKVRASLPHGIVTVTARAGGFQKIPILGVGGAPQFLLGISDVKPRQIIGSQAFPDLEKIRAMLVRELRLKIPVYDLLLPEGRVVVFEVGW